jgi:hypothetical protein
MIKLGVHGKKAKGVLLLVLTTAVKRYADGFQPSA